jgi:hypothetical protein
MLWNELEVPIHWVNMPPHGNILPPFTISSPSPSPILHPDTRPGSLPPPGRDGPPQPGPVLDNDPTSEPLDDQDSSEDSATEEEEEEEEEDFESLILKAFPKQPTLRELALHLLGQLWMLHDEPEPELDKRHQVTQRALQGIKNPGSRFAAFFDPSQTHRCRWYVDGKRCGHESPRKDRAIGHSRSHFQYKPFQCKGKCGKRGW